GPWPLSLAAGAVATACTSPDTTTTGACLVAVRPGRHRQAPFGRNLGTSLVVPTAKARWPTVWCLSVLFASSCRNTPRLHLVAARRRQTRDSCGSGTAVSQRAVFDSAGRTRSCGDDCTGRRAECQ